MYIYLEKNKITWEEAKVDVCSTISNFNTKNIFKLYINNVLVFDDKIKNSLKQLALKITNATCDNYKDFIYATHRYLYHWQDILNVIIETSNEYD